MISYTAQKQVSANPGVLQGKALRFYFAVSGNDPSLWFFNQVKWHWLRSLRRRSQRAFINWERNTRLVARFLPGGKYARGREILVPCTLRTA